MGTVFTAWNIKDIIGFFEYLIAQRVVLLKARKYLTILSHYLAQYNANFTALFNQCTVQRSRLRADFVFAFC